MGITRFFTGTSKDGTRYDFVEERSDSSDVSKDANPAMQTSPKYRLRLDGAYLTKVSDNEFKIDKSGVTICVR